jgi:hypothetical protein
MPVGHRDHRLPAASRIIQTLHLSSDTTGTHANKYAYTEYHALLKGFGFCCAFDIQKKMTDHSRRVRITTSMGIKRRLLARSLFEFEPFCLFSLPSYFPEQNTTPLSRSHYPREQLLLFASTNSRRRIERRGALSRCATHETWRYGGSTAINPLNCFSRTSRSCVLFKSWIEGVRPHPGMTDTDRTGRPRPTI